MERSFIEAPPNVVSEDGLRRVLEEGWDVELVCRRNAEKRHNNWYGEWVLRAISPDGTQERQLVTARSDMEFRTFKTANGAISFLADMGCAFVHIPLKQGGRCRQGLGG